MLMWAMSDRAIPRSYRTMQGFGVHTFRLVNADGRVALRQVPLDADGGHATRWCGTRRSRSRAPTPTSIAATCGKRSRPAPIPSGSSGLQIFTEEQAEDFTFDVLDATKLVPEELVPVMPVGTAGAEPQPRQLLRRDRAGRVLHARTSSPGIDFSNDPLLAGRIHSYVDTQISRLGGAELPRDPDQRADRAGAQQPARRHAPPGDPSRPRRRTSRTRSAAAARSRPARRASSRFPSRAKRATHKVRGKAERFADHYTQATLFLNSQTPTEQAHIINAFRFELSRVQTPAIRERMVSGLMNVAPELAEAVAEGLGMTEMPEPMPKVLQKNGQAGGARSRRRSRCSRGLATAASARAASRSSSPTASNGKPLVDAGGASGRGRRGAALRRVAARPGHSGRRRRRSRSTRPFEATPSVLFDAVVLPDGADAVTRSRRGRPDARVREGPVPPLQADPRARRGVRAARQGRAFRRRCRRAQPDPGLISLQPGAGEQGRSTRSRPARRARIATSRAKPIRRASDHQTTRKEQTAWPSRNPARRVHRRAPRRLRRGETADQGAAENGEGREPPPRCGPPSRATSRRRRARSSGSRRCSRASTRKCAASTATASTASSKRASRSWRRTSTTRRWTPA